MTRLAALALVTLSACHGGRLAATTPGAGRAAATEETTDMTAELEPLRAYPGATTPEALAALDPEVASNEAFDDAVAAFRAGDYARAARRFLAATEPILVARTAFNGELMAENRLACYANAQRAFRRAGAYDEGNAALAEAAARDPDNAEAIQALIAGLRGR